MRRRVVGWLMLLMVGVISLPAAQAQEASPDDPARGLIYRGLVRGAPDGPCGGLFEIRHRGRLVGCTHGPDAAPEGVDVRQRRSPEPFAAQSAEGSSAASVPSPICHGDGQSGYRVQLLYARASDMPDRYAQYVESFRIWATRMDDIINLSAAHTGGTRHIRFVHTPSCVPIIEKVELSPTGDDYMNATIDELVERGYNRVDRKYLVWMDANIYCGMGLNSRDDSPGQDNRNNGSGHAPGLVARIDNGCWGRSAPNTMLEAHELTHTLGAVMSSAPHATPAGHCTDEYDLMCYPDGPGVQTQIVCDGIYDFENRLDCNHDDYFHTNPPAGNYLATHWNVANSRFLSAQGTTTVTPTSGEPGDPVTISASGATPNGAYRVRLGTAAATCPTSPLVLGGTVNADAAGTIPPVTRVLPTNTTSGNRFLCFARVGDPADSTAPTSFTVV